MPLAHDRKALNLKRSQTPIGDLASDRVRRDKGDAETRNNGLLNGLVRADFHTDDRREASPLEQAFHEHARAGAELACEERLIRQALNCDLSPESG